MTWFGFPADVELERREPGQSWQDRFPAALSIVVCTGEG